MSASSSSCGTPEPLPLLGPADLAKHASAKSCYVTLGRKVYDVTTFLPDHPGGADLILPYAGKDVAAILRDETEHEHSDAAYEILDDCLVGFVDDGDSTWGRIEAAPLAALTPDTGCTELGSDGRKVYAATGMATAEDLSKETDIATDYKTHRFLDLNKPLLMQVFNGGFSKQFYLEQVHRPRHYKGGASAPLFGNFLEPLSLTPWYVVPAVWLPCVAYGTWVASKSLSPAATVGFWLFGLWFWTIIEYVLHRGLFHLDDYLPDNRFALTLHFLLHGIHHYLPMDRYRLVMPPTLFALLAYPFWHFSRLVLFFDMSAALAAFCGGVAGYVAYDLTHYFLHHHTLPRYWRELKKYHMEHHFRDYQRGFGVTSRFWDWVFGTELVGESKGGRPATKAKTVERIRQVELPKSKVIKAA